jgi:hypothetical protein
LIVIAKFQIRVLLVGTTVVVLTLTEHWLFCNVVADPSVAACHTAPLSLSELIWLVTAS